MYLVGSIPLLVYRRDTAVVVLRHSTVGFWWTSEHQESKHCVGSFAACKFNDRSGKSVYFILRTNMLL